MKSYFLILFLLLTQVLVAQKSPNKVYCVEKKAQNIDLPTDRNVYGGTIIRVSYKGSRISDTQKGAFEYACKLVEEAIPTTYPIKLSVEFSNLQDAECLALVEPYPVPSELKGDAPLGDRVFVKRSMKKDDFFGFDSDDSQQSYTAAYNFFENDVDANIKFSARNIFYYGIDTKGLKSNKFDFITVAIQAIVKAIGFSCRVYENGSNKLYYASPTNKYTDYEFGRLTPEQLYSKAVSGKCNLKGYNLICNPPYQQGVSLNYFVDSDDKETAFLQYGVSKGAYVRYVGKALRSFCSECSWDDNLVTGKDSYTYVDGNTGDVIPFVGVGTRNVGRQKILVESSGDWRNITSKYDVYDDGSYVLLKDGTWRAFLKLSDLSDNEDYARTPEGFLRLMQITTTFGPNSAYTNSVSSFKLYSYLPQKPKASVNSYLLSDINSINLRLKRCTAKALSDEDVFVDVEIGLKDIEGTEQVVVEQTDSDYPVPFTYVVDNPGEGSFVALMNSKYSSSFKLTYVNKNGKTEGDNFTVDLSKDANKLVDSGVKVLPKGNRLFLKTNSMDNDNYEYCIYAIQTGKCVLKGMVNSNYKIIDASSLNAGIYSIAVYRKSKKCASCIWRKNN